MEDKVYVLNYRDCQTEERTTKVYRSISHAQEEMVGNIGRMLSELIDNGELGYIQTKICDTTAEIYSVANDERDHEWWITGVTIE